MTYNLEKMMVDIIDNWDSSIFFYGGDTSSVGYTNEQYKMLGFENKQDFQTDEFFEEFNFSNRIQGNDTSIGKMFNDDDKDMLPKHANSLFDGIVEKDKIYRYMLKLALHLNRYRYLKTRDKAMNKLNTIGREYPKKNYTKKAKPKKLKELAEKMILLMGGHNVVHEGITNELKKVSEYPHMYLLDNNLKIAIPKKIIKAYLFGLKINKETEIQNFIKEIDK